MGILFLFYAAYSIVVSWSIAVELQHPRIKGGGGIVSWIVGLGDSDTGDYNLSVFIVLLLFSILVFGVCAAVAAPLEFSLSLFEEAPPRGSGTGAVLSILIGASLRIASALVIVVALSSAILVAIDRFGLIQNHATGVILSKTNPNDISFSSMRILEDVRSPWKSYFAQCSWEMVNAVPIVRLPQLLNWREPLSKQVPDLRIAFFFFRLVAIATTWSVVYGAMGVFRARLNSDDRAVGP